MDLHQKDLINIIGTKSRGNLAKSKIYLNDLRLKSSYNLAAFSFSPEMIFSELLKFNPSFKINYSPDFRQGIADSWPNNMNDILKVNNCGFLL